VIATIKERVTIESVLGDVGVTLSRGRAGCPLCGSTNRTAFSVRGERWICFVCGERGDAIDLYANLHGLDTRTAIKHLAQRAGIRQGTLSPSERQALKKARRERERRAALLKALDEWTKKQRNTIAPLIRGARRMLARGISHREALELGAEFFDSFAYLEHVHDDVLARDDRAAHLQLYKDEAGI